MLLEAYWKYCNPWTPVVDKDELHEKFGELSPLLSQAVLMAGSRLASVPSEYVSSKELYAKAKTLFWLGVEKDPLNSLVASCIMQWWTPHGPENFSIDTAYSWLRASVGIAFQIGMHKDGKAGVGPSFQRKIWWSLVVSNAFSPGCFTEISIGKRLLYQRGTWATSRH